MSFNFDESVDRSHTDSEKWAKYAEHDILPLWLADSDFRVAPCISNALHSRLTHDLFGYGKTPFAFQQVTADWLTRRHGWQVDPDWVVPLQGTKSALALVIEQFCPAGQTLITHSPTYPLFLELAEKYQCPLRRLALHPDRTHWQPEGNLSAVGCFGTERLLMLCNPHNPTGHMFRRQELEALAHYAVSQDLIVCSDEIHADLLLEPKLRHIPFASLNEQCAARSITLVSPSKAFNIAGLGVAAAVIPNPILRQRFNQALAGRVPEPNIMGVTAAQAAWREGEPWLEAQNRYLRANRDRLVAAVSALRGVELIAPEAGFLAWIDCRGLRLPSPAAWFETYGLGLSPGAPFGAAQAVRLNFACSRERLELAIGRLNIALEART